jgi:hypothetical protein
MFFPSRRILTGKLLKSPFQNCIQYLEAKNLDLPNFEGTIVSEITFNW